MLVDTVAPEEIKSAICELLTAKRVSPELGMGDPIPEINRFMESEFSRYGTVFSGQGRPDINESQEVREELNEIFRRSVKDRFDDVRSDG